MKTISFVIPVYNEEKRINKTFSALKSFTPPESLTLREVIFVDDGSTDITKSKIKNQKSKLEKTLNAKVKIISYRINKGKGYAVKQGMLSSNSDYTLFFDADMSTPLTELNKFLPFMNDNKDVIIGTRKNGKSTVVVHQPKIREFLGRGFTLITKKLLRLTVSDFTCGFKAFSKNSKNKIFSASSINAWGYDAEIVFLANKYKFSIQEKPVIWSNDKNSKVKIYKAVPQTFVELFLIYWYHEISPRLLSFGSLANMDRFGLSMSKFS